MTTAFKENKNEDLNKHKVSVTINCKNSEIIKRPTPKQYCIEKPANIETKA